MAETLGSLCDKLTIVKLKQYHSTDSIKLNSLQQQAKSLVDEIDLYITDALSGEIPIGKLVFESNKIYKAEGNEMRDINGDFGEVFNKLAEVNCELWHEQEKVYEFHLVPEKEKNQVINRLAVLNLERNRCIDTLNSTLSDIITSMTRSQKQKPEKTIL